MLISPSFSAQPCPFPSASLAVSSFGEFNPFTFKVITDKYDPIAIYYVVWGSILYNFSVFPV